MGRSVMGKLQNKIYVVTGANSGIGLAAAESFAEQGAEVVLVCRNEARGRAAQQKIQQTSGNENIHLEIADFSSLRSISTLADRLLARYPRIDVLCNNAGGANAGRKLTAEGFELTFATNHLSGFLLTKKLLPSLLDHEGDPARVVFTSSLGHKNSPLDFDDLGLEKDYGTLKAYGRSKLMNLLTARELHKRYGDSKLIASSFHPGAVRTPIWSKGGILARLIGLVMYPFMWSIEKGADTFIWLASAEDAEVLSAEGSYFFDRRKPRIAQFATDEAAAELWHVSEQLIEPYFEA
ncbi:MAG TPA: short-chain dehydrogenase [Gammaproteobacteria bacterium]|mgnify:CR=1 FL=1|nr:short-chain dehydrogenase [Gammaproteobacteria bacterium]HAR89880.1 short-chain dehydrogenase [Gammaproteobacteria bacterium]HCL71555.1 short-chain dehydrogenase [Gammaproteobacteria bacterium]